MRRNPAPPKPDAPQIEVEVGRQPRFGLQHPLPQLVRRGRPPKPGGPMPQVEVQRAYRDRLKAAGKTVRLVDADFVNITDAAAQEATVTIHTRPSIAMMDDLNCEAA
jgi:hypothetical protein